MDGTPGHSAVGSCLFRSCLGALGACLALVITFWIWAATEPGRNEDEARTDMRDSADIHAEALARAAADGGLSDTDLAEVFAAGGPAKGLLDVARGTGSVRLTVGLAGRGPGFLLVSETWVDGCYLFDVTLEPDGGARVSARQTSDGTCGGLVLVNRRPSPSATR